MCISLFKFADENKNTEEEEDEEEEEEEEEVEEEKEENGKAKINWKIILDLIPTSSRQIIYYYSSNTF